nr:MAG TPA: hypothetical protein [Caudoviricetes sp.]
MYNQNVKFMFEKILAGLKTKFPGVDSKNLRHYKFV